MCSNETKVNCRCDADGEAPKFNAEQAKVVFSCSVAALCLGMILFPYLLRYITKNVQRKKAKDQTRDVEVAENSGEKHDMPTWLCYRKIRKKRKYT